MAETAPDTPSKSVRAAVAEAFLARQASTSQPDASPQAALDRAERKRAFLKIINDETVAKNSRAVALDTLELLITLTSNALQDPTKRSIRPKNATIKRRLVDVEGGIHYLQACRWSTRTLNFEEHLAFPDAPTATQLDYLTLGAEALVDRTQQLKDLYARTETNRKFEADKEAVRKEKALLAAREDRLATAQRVERERIGREAKAALDAMQEAAGESPTRSSPTRKRSSPRKLQEDPEYHDEEDASDD